MLAVITADVVQSAKTEPQLLKRAQTYMQERIALLREHDLGNGELYRGDGIQIALREPHRALDCMLELGAYLAYLGIKLTLSVAVAEGQLSQSVGVSQGPAFTLSGRTLDQASRGQWLFTSSHPQLSAEFDCTLDLIGFLVQQWTPKQSEVIHYWLTHERCDQQTIAKGLQMTPQNVSLHWRKAAGPQLARCLEQFEKRCKSRLEPVK